MKYSLQIPLVGIAFAGWASLQQSAGFFLSDMKLPILMQKYSNGTSQ